MNFKLKPGETVVQRVATVLSATTTEAVELRHVLCGKNGNSSCSPKICVRTDMLIANLTLTKGTTTALVDGVYVTDVHVSGKLLYQPENGCTSPYVGFNSPIGHCSPCPEEDVIFSSFKIYSTVDDIEISACAATATPITYSNCQDFTNQVLITLPYSVDSASKFKSTKA